MDRTDIIGSFVIGALLGALIAGIICSTFFRIQGERDVAEMKLKCYTHKQVKKGGE